MVVKEFKKTVRETAQGSLMRVRVVPAGKQFAVIGFDEWTQALKVRLRAKPEKGKANQELLEKLGKLFNATVEIVEGKKKQHKMLLIRAKKSRVIECLSKFL